MAESRGESVQGYYRRIRVLEKLGVVEVGRRFHGRNIGITVRRKSRRLVINEFKNVLFE